MICGEGTSLHTRFSTNVNSPQKGDRVHIHAEGNVINIHEELLKLRVDNDWAYGVIFKHTNANEERHYSDYVHAYFWYALKHWLHNGHWPSDYDIRAWNITGWAIPPDGERGAEVEPLAVSLAIEVYLEAWAKPWWNVVDATMTFVFEQYRNQRITPSPERIAQAYEREHESPLKELFVDLHYGVCYTDWSEQYDVNTKFEEEECGPRSSSSIWLSSVGERSIRSLETPARRLMLLLKELNRS